MKSTVLVTALAVSFFFINAPARAGSISLCDGVSGNLVKNCGFETGDTSNWTQGGDTSFTAVSGLDGDSNSGSYAMYFGPTTDFGYISQMIPTIAGHTYNVRFQLRNDDDTNTGGDDGGGALLAAFAIADGDHNGFGISWGGTNLGAPMMNMDPFAYTQFSIRGLVATSASTELQLGFFNSPDYFYLDDITVEDAAGPSVPEPGTMALLGGGFLALGVVRFRKRKA